MRDLIIAYVQSGVAGFVGCVGFMLACFVVRAALDRLLTRVRPALRARGWRG